jgi:hypothetical protein
MPDGHARAHRHARVELHDLGGFCQTAPHNHPSSSTGAGLFSALSTAMANATRASMLSLDFILSMRSRAGYRGRWLGVEVRAVPMSQPALNDCYVQPLRRRAKPGVGLRKRDDRDATFGQLQRRRLEPPRVERDLGDRKRLAQLADLVGAFEDRPVAVEHPAVDAEVFGAPHDRRRGPLATEVAPTKIRSAGLIFAVGSAHFAHAPIGNQC